MLIDARVSGSALFALLLCACSTTYKPLALDPKTGLYDTRTTVDAGGVSVAKVRVSPKDFGAVLVVADSNKYPSRLEFATRRALAELGYANVINVQELRDWASDLKFDMPADKITGQVLKDFSVRMKPLLIVDMRYGYVGNTQHFAGLRVVDGRSLQVLLAVTHPKGVWVSVDEEIIYPVFNELRRWHRQMTEQPA